MKVLFVMLAILFIGLRYDLIDNKSFACAKKVSKLNKPELPNCK